jgi:predicted esterase
VNGTRNSLALSRRTPPPHGDEPVLLSGTPLDAAKAAIVLVHGRGGHPDDMLALCDGFKTDGFALVAPAAAGGTWYPLPFIAPLEQNEPHLSSALLKLEAVVEELSVRGIPSSKVLLLGFSQGACLVLEFAGRYARRWGGVAGLSGGLIGPPGRRWNFLASLSGAPIFLGCSDEDPHIPAARLHETAAELRRIGGEVDLRVYRGLGHTINGDEIRRVQEMIDRI